jgi:hypothetical protein
MQNEPIEINLMKNSARARISSRLSEKSPTADVRDAAFDDYRRIDIAALPSDRPRSDAAGMTKALIADIATQLDTLDRQREQLAALLRDVNL